MFYGKYNYNHPHYDSDADRYSDFYLHPDIHLHSDLYMHGHAYIHGDSLYIYQYSDFNRDAHPHGDIYSD